MKMFSAWSICCKKFWIVIVPISKILSDALTSTNFFSVLFPSTSTATSSANTNLSGYCSSNDLAVWTEFLSSINVDDNGTWSDAVRKALPIRPPRRVFSIRPALISFCIDFPALDYEFVFV